MVTLSMFLWNESIYMVHIRVRAKTLQIALSGAVIKAIRAQLKSF